MQTKYSLTELKKTYFSEAENWKDMPETTAELKKACAELKELVPNEKLCNDIKDCFGASLDKYQMQGFINGFIYAAMLPLEAKGTVHRDLKKNGIADIVEITDTASSITEELDKIKLLLSDLRSEFFDSAKFDTEEDLKSAKYYFPFARTRFEIIDDYADILKTHANSVNNLALKVHARLSENNNEVTANA